MSAAGADLTMKRLRPFWGRVTILETLVDEEERDSGLIVPLTHDRTGDFRRGVLLAVADGGPYDIRTADLLEVGMVVFFRGGIRIIDVIVVELQDVLAYEADE